MAYACNLSIQKVDDSYSELQNNFKANLNHMNYRKRDRRRDRRQETEGEKGEEREESEQLNG